MPVETSEVGVANLHSSQQATRQLNTESGKNHVESREIDDPDRVIPFSNDDIGEKNKDSEFLIVRESSSEYDKCGSDKVWTEKLISAREHWNEKIDHSVSVIRITKLKKKSHINRKTQIIGSKEDLK